MKEAHEFITEVDIYYVAWHVCSYQIIGGYFFSTDTRTYGEQLNNKPFVLRRYVAPPGHGLVDMEVFSNEKELRLEPVWGPIHLFEPRKTIDAAPILTEAALHSPLPSSDTPVVSRKRKR